MDKIIRITEVSILITHILLIWAALIAFVVMVYVAWKSGDIKFWVDKLDKKGDRNDIA